MGIAHSPHKKGFGVQADLYKQKAILVDGLFMAGSKGVEPL